MKIVETFLTIRTQQKLLLMHTVLFAIIGIGWLGYILYAGPKYITLRFVGDIMLDRGVKASVERNFAGDYSKLFAQLGDDYKNADIFFANLEGPVTTKGIDMQNLYSFRMNPSVLPVLKSAGVDVVSFANNHVGDWERVGFTDSLINLIQHKIPYAGAGINRADAEKPKIINRYGIRFGFLGFTDVGPEWLEATKDSAGILLANDKRYAEIIGNAKKDVDVLIVSMHAGNEYEKETLRQKRLAHTAIDAGASLFIGHHAHVIQGVKKYKDGLIAYGLGNFIFDQKFSKETMQGLTLEVKINRNKKIDSYTTFTTVQNQQLVPVPEIAK